MSYIKTSWVDNVTPIDKDNLNKIEQGIYDNSLVADAVNANVKPTGDAYASVEITEGQITDVLAVNDVLIKGNTLQDGEPTPDSPVDINVVSGSNVIVTSNINLFPLELTYKGTIINQTRATVTLDKDEYVFTATGTDMYFGNVANSGETFNGTPGYLIKIPDNTSTIYLKLTNSAFNSNFITFYNENKVSLGFSNVSGSKAVPANAKYFTIRIGVSNSVSGTIYKTKVIASTQDISYTPHQGKELPLDLPVENLFDKDNANVKNGYIVANIPTIGDNGATNKITYIEIKPNTTYTVSKNNFSLDAFGIASTVDIPAKDVPITQKAVDKFANSLTITTGANDNYLVVYCKGQGIIFPELFNNIDLQIEEGEKVNAYTPYGVAPIELCKIGDYQDYFYRDNGKWYLHKEIGKINFSDLSASKSGVFALYTSIPNIKYVSTNTEIGSVIAEKYKVRQGSGLSDYPNYLAVDVNRVTVYVGADVDNASGLFYYALKETTDTEITDTTLINQLEAIYNAPLYEQTNITQTNNDLPMVLDITACKDNINGIKAWIRK